MQTKLATRQFLCDLPLGDRITPRYILSVRPFVCLSRAHCYVAHYVWPYHETVRMSVCPSVCHVSYLENGAR